MRERHNIIGTEVGRPRPPFYSRPGIPVGKRSLATGWIGAAAALLLIVLGGLVGLKVVGAIEPVSNTAGPAAAFSEAASPDSAAVARW